MILPADMERATVMISNISDYMNKNEGTSVKTLNYTPNQTFRIMKRWHKGGGRGPLLDILSELGRAS